MLINMMVINSNGLGNQNITLSHIDFQTQYIISPSRIRFLYTQPYDQEYI